MPVDVSTLALELSTTGLQRGHREAESLLSRLEARLDRAVQKAQQASKQFNDAFSFKGGGGQGASAAVNNLDRTAAATRKAADEAVRYAQTLARLKQIQGDLAGAIRVLGDAIAKAGDARPIVALRAQLQKTYLETGYASSPLISAIRQTRVGFEGLPPIISKATGLVTGFVGGIIGGGLLAGIERLGSISIEAAIGIDKSRQTLIALTGSADAANRKLAELRELAAKTPGITSSIAIDVFSQLRVTEQIADDTINKLIKGIGRLNAVFSIDDSKQFSRNLTQIFAQGFERADIKEALGRVPIFEKILEQAFGTKDADKLRKLKESGQLTLNSYASGIADAINSNPVLSKVGESLGSKFEKAKDNILVALEPIGARLGTLLLTATEQIGKQLQNSQDDILDLIASAEDFGRTLTSVFDRGTGSIIDLRAELEAVRGIIDFVHGGVLFLKDSFELLGTLAVGVVKQIALTIETALSKALGFFGVQIAALEEDIIRLSGDLSGLENRFNQGFINTRNFQNRVADRNIVVDFGNSIPINPQTGKPLNPADLTPFVPTSGTPSTRTRSGGARRGESDARQLRAAEEELAKARAAAEAAIQERSLRSQLEKEKEYFAERLTNAEQFFVERKRIELALLAITEQRTREELKASAARFSQAKEGSPEGLRELAQIIELRSRLKGLDIDRADKLRELNAELEKNLKAEREITKERLAAASGSVREGLSRAGEQLQGIDRAQLERPASELRKTEIQLQAAANAGILRETELQDALTLARRAAREELLASLQVERARAEKSTDANRFSQIQQLDEQILSIQTLGSELTRAEALQRRFADQGVLDYRRLNEGVEDLLASQKGLTEIFSDFRANLVADQFGLIETGVDALTKKLGVFGDAIGQLLKDLAKLAISKVFQKLFGLGGGGTPGIQFGGAPQQQGGGGFNPLSLITGGGNGGGFSLPGLAPSGGGGFGQFATGGFAGGNPVQQILGGGSSGGGGGLLGKIPFIGKLFGGGGGQSLVGGIGKNIGDLPGAIQGVGLPPLQAPGGAIGGAGTGLGASFASLGAGGLLAGGGLLGSLAGGNSQIGRLLGGVGGSLLGGAVGASGLLGGGIAGALPALFSNPITAIVGGALIGGALLARFIGDREFNRFRKDVRGEYQIEVDKKDQGRALYKSIKELGEQAFGKGKFGKRIPETIRLPKAQEQLAAYGEATGQNASSLVTRFRDARELQDPFDARNQFIKRATGGGVVAGQPYIVGDAGRPEVFTSRVSGEIFPSIRAFEQQLLQSLQASKVLGGIFAGAKQQLIGQLSANTRQGAPEAERFDGRRMERAIAAVGIGLASLSEEVGRLKFASPNDVVMKADAGTVADKTAEGLATGGQRVTDMQVHLGL